MKYNLTEITAIIQNRRTIYPENYSNRVVQKDIIEQILKNAIWAPTHGLTQPWRFKVITGNAINRFAKANAEIYKQITPLENFSEKKYDNFNKRPLMTSVIIAICMQRQETEKIKEIEEIEAVACAVQNMHLTCTAYGLGAFWSTGGATYTKEMEFFLKLKTKERCLGFLYIGYPNSEWPKGSRKPIEYVTEWISE